MLLYLLPDKFPIPMISVIPQSMHDANGYWQTAINKNDKQKTDFTTLSRHFEFNVMLFGMKMHPQYSEG